jgi:hypothetical protein
MKTARFLISETGLNFFHRLVIDILANKDWRSPSCQLQRINFRFSAIVH